MSDATVSHTFRLDWGLHALLRLLAAHRFDSVLDVGAGAGDHTRFLRLFGKEVHSVDLATEAERVGDFIDLPFERRFDVVWCSHVLEHQRNVGLFLDKLYAVLDEGGVLALVLPLHPRERLISGHLTSWSAPLVCYNLVMAGFDCRDAEILSTYELSVLVARSPALHPERGRPAALGADAGSAFESLARFFPFPAHQGAVVPLDARFNWPDPVDYALPAPRGIDGTAIRIESKNLTRRPQLVPRVRFA